MNFTEFFCQGFKPQKNIKITEWAESNIVLSEKDSKETGRFRISRTPYTRAIQDALSIDSPTKEVTFIAGAQIAKSRTGLNFLGYIMDIAPGPILLVLPTVQSAKEFMEDRVDALIEETQVLNNLFSSNKKDPNNKKLKKIFPGGQLTATGANSPTGLKSKPIRYLILEEIDEYVKDLKNQGNPLELAKLRTNTFNNKKIYKNSTPTDQHSAIWAEYKKGTMEKYYVPCPYCEEKQPLIFGNLKFQRDENDRLISDSVHYKCQFCEKEIKEHHKTWMLDNGFWVQENHDPEEKFHRSFHISSLYSPLGWKSWEDICREFLRAKKDPTKILMKKFVNTILGEIWEDRGQQTDINSLFKRKEMSNYLRGYIDPSIILLTGGVDIQPDRICLLTLGWGKNEEAFIIDYKEFLGDVSKDENVWKELKNNVYKKFKHPSGVDLEIRYVGIDTGHQAQKVYDFCSKNKKFLAVKGSSKKIPVLLAKPSTQDIKYENIYIKNGIQLYQVGTEIAKEEIMARLKIEEAGEKFINFPKDLDDTAIEMLTAEKYITKYIKGYAVKVWEKFKDRNETLDCFVYALAIARGICNIDTINEDLYEQYYLELYGDYGKVVEEVKKEEEKKAVNAFQVIRQQKKNSSFVKNW